MATATMTYVGPADGQDNVTLMHVGNIQDTQAPYFFATYREIYGPKVFESTDRETGVVTERVEYTDAELWEKYTQGIAAGTAANVQRYLEEQAKAAALSNLAAIQVNQIQ